MNHLKRHLSVANVISCIALFVALSGATYAATTVSKNSVKAKSIAKGAVTKPKLRNGAVTTAKIRNGAVTMAKIRNGAVVGAKIAPGAVGSTQLLDGGVRSIDLGGQVVTTGKLKDEAVTREKLAGNTVTASKIAADSVTTGKIQDGAVTAAKLAPSFNAQLLKNVSYVSATSLSNSSEAAKTVTATCPSGKKVLGGGARIAGTTTTVAITQSAPPSDAFLSTRPTSWEAKAAAIAAEANPWAVEAFAVCAEP